MCNYKKTICDPNVFYHIATKQDLVVNFQQPVLLTVEKLQMSICCPFSLETDLHHLNCLNIQLHQRKLTKQLPF